MKSLTLSALLALATALPVVAQSSDEALPPPDVTPRAKRVFDGERPTAPPVKRPGKKPTRGARLPSQTVRGTIRGEGAGGELRLELAGTDKALPLRGKLLDLLRSRALGRTLSLRVVAQKAKKGHQPGLLVLAAKGTAKHDLPVYAKDANPDFDAPLGTLAEGSSCWVHTGGSFALVTSPSVKGQALLSEIEFGVPAEAQAQAEQSSEPERAGAASSGRGGILSALGGERDAPAEAEEPRVGPR